MSTISAKDGARDRVADPRWQWHAAHVIPSDAAAVRRVLDELLQQLRNQAWPEHDLFGIRLALEEALVNAVRHGNRLDPNKVVDVAARLSADRIHVRITDQGTGFDPAAVPDCTAPENLEIPGGRGLALMRHYMSRVEFNPLGNSVTLEKQRSTAA